MTLSQFPKQSLTGKILAQYKECYFISPHLDDAVFSAGGLMQLLAKHIKVEVINVFSKSLPTKPTFSAKKYLKIIGIMDPIKLYEKRVTEDKDTLRRIGVTVHNLDYVEALWRQNPSTSLIRNFLGNLLPEIKAAYPTYRWHILSGHIVHSDKKLMGILIKQLHNITKHGGLVVAPLGIGRHVDHILVRNVCSRLQRNVMYWSDIPYNQTYPIDKTFIRKESLKVQVLPIRYKDKAKLIQGYQSQETAIRPVISSSLSTENYYVPKVLL